MSRKDIRVLVAEADRERLQPVLDQLRAKGLQVSEAGSGLTGQDTVLAALSENFYADSGKTESLLNLIGSGAENVLPLQLDTAPVPDTLMNALYSRNIIPASGRDAALIAGRILEALPKKKSRLPAILTVCALLLAALAGFLVWRSSRPEPEPPVEEEIAVETPEPSPEPTLPIPAGLTAEDLEQIVDVVIVGEQAEFYTSLEAQAVGGWPSWDTFAYRDYDENGAHFYSREDGHEYTLTRYDDLRFLSLMPNLRSLHLCVVDTGELPDLSGMEKLRTVDLMDCVVPDLGWLSGSPVRDLHILNTSGSVRNFSTLAACEQLERLHIDLSNTQEADLSGLTLPRLDWLWINNGQDLRGDLDLSGLEGCHALRECRLEWGIPIADLSFLRGAARLEILSVQDSNRLRDISALENLTSLKELQIEECRNIADYSPIAGCKSLETIRLEDNGRDLQGAPFLAGLQNLRNINLQAEEIGNLNFLAEHEPFQRAVNLEFAGRVSDFSGLAAVPMYGRLRIDPGNARVEQILPFLQDASIQELLLARFADINLSELASLRPTLGVLELDRCGITDLSGLPESLPIREIRLNKCANLRSLEGLQNLSRIGKGGGQVTVFVCPRLTDWSALDGMRLSALDITGGFTLPSFESLSVGILKLDSVGDVPDLSFLDEMDNASACSFTLVGLDEVDSLQPLERFFGTYLAVPPQLAEQAGDLVKAGKFKEVRIEYPQGGWEMDEMHFSLLSLDELETLPKALLRRVDSLCLVGDMVVDLERYDVWTNWINNREVPVLFDRESEEEIPVMTAGSVTDFGVFSELTGLRRLRLFSQPLTSLDGVQNFENLEELTVCLSPALTDASPAFALQGLRYLCLKQCPIESIQGVQNLSALGELDINNTRVTDLSPLAECDFSTALRERGGFRLFINGLAVEDFSPLAQIPVLDNLDINDVDAALYVPCLEGVELHRFSSANSFSNRCTAEDVNALFADFVRSHPQLNDMMISWNQRITDLTPLLELENLEQVRVSHDMQAAIASLEGQEYAFRLDIEG